MSDTESYFIAGTDTEVGKTFTTCALLHRARADGRTALAMKPIAAGAEEVDGRLINEDAAALTQACSFDPGLELLNPICLAEAIAPHIAAANEGVRIEPEPIFRARDALAAQADLLLIEGVGGFRVPLDDDYDTADLAVALGAPVILVVGLRLGCINHALLTVDAIAARGLPLAGWIGNAIDPEMSRREENLTALEARIDAPLLGTLPHLAGGDARELADRLSLPAPHEPSNAVLILDSAAELGPAHRGRVVVTGSHGGASAARYAAAVKPALVFFNDAGGGKDDAGYTGLALLDEAGIAAACYAHDSACIGDGRDAFGNGRVSRANLLASGLGVRAGDPVVAAATLASGS